MDIAVWIVGGVISIYTAYNFYKAGRFKATSTRETLLGAGFGWIEKVPFGTVRTIAWLELAGAAGLVAAPIAFWFGLEWSLWLAAAAGLGLALTMVGAIWVHAARGESKFTFKMNLRLLAVAVASAGAWLTLALG